MAFRVPSFNLWCAVYRQQGLVLKGYSRCQLRGPVNTYVPFLSGAAFGNSLRTPWEILFPAGSDVCSAQWTGANSGDIIYLGDSARHQYYVYWVGDKAAGFSNEYRLVFALQVNEAGVIPVARVNPLWFPPEGYLPLPIIDRFPAT